VTRAFVHRALAARVRFGVGALERRSEEVDAVALTRVMVICGPSHQALGRRAADLLGDRGVAPLGVAVAVGGIGVLPLARVSLRDVAVVGAVEHG